MALEFSLVLETPCTPLALLTTIAHDTGLTWSDDSHLLGQGVWISAIEETARGQALMEELFGFRSTVVVGFRINPKEDYQEGKHTVLRATMVVLKQNVDHAVLLFNGEDIVLQAAGQRLLLNADWGQWPATQLAEVTLPYELRPLPSPLL